jgi:hypothetical protein
LTTGAGERPPAGRLIALSGLSARPGVSGYCGLGREPGYRGLGREPGYRGLGREPGRALGVCGNPVCCVRNGRGAAPGRERLP